MYEIGQEEIDAVAKVIRSGQMFRYRGGEGGETDTFEKRMCEKLGAKHFLAVTNGTAALVCGLAGLEIGPGDEVLVPAYTWLASPAAALEAGAIPVLVECDESLTMCPIDLEKKIGPRTKAIMPVHMAGQPCNMDRIMAIAQKHNLKVIEDACQAVGGSYRGKRLTTIGHVGAFSFNQFKNISCGEGGGLTTSDTKAYHRALIHHDLGSNFRAHVGTLEVPIFLGGNYRFNEILGAIMNVQLTRLDSILERLRARKKVFFKALKPHAAYRQSPCNDQDGDCAKNYSLLFESVAARTQFTEKFKEIAPDIGVSSPINSGIHVYSNWKPLIGQRASYHEGTCAYHHPANKDCRKITANDCPKT
ncbi:MAG: DegT/DnrJ/EryC1/StrS family aminotransferase, partial [Planctomycetota bacterium]